MMLTCPHCAGPLELTAPRGVETPAAGTDKPHQVLRGKLLEYLRLVNSTELTTAAQHVFRVDAPTLAQRQRVRRGLDALVREGALSRSTRSVKGWNGGQVTVWRLTGAGGRLTRT